MGSTRILDFDRARSDRRKTVLRAFGREVPVPGSPPLGFVMLTDQLKQEKGSDYEPGFDELAELVESMIGTEAFSWVMSNAPEQDDLEWIMEALVESWGEDDDEGEAQAPEQGAGSDIAESNGASSKPTSPESMGTTSAPPSETPTTPSAVSPSA